MNPEVKDLPSGIAVCNFSIATNRIWTDKDGEKKEEVAFHNVVFFGKQAVTIHKYVSKGMLLLVEGRIQTRSWEDKESGKKMYKTEIVGENFQLPPKSMGGGSAPSDNDSDVSSKKETPVDAIEYPDDEVNPEDIPF